jgi:hypothetical protein
MPSAVVVIPIYSLSLSDDEQFSLEVARTKLGQHPRYFVAPDGLEIPNDFL